MTADGYIKFNCDFVESQALALEKITELNKWRDKLYAMGLVGAYDNGIGFGNISVRIPGTNQFIITGSATGNLPKLDASGYTTVISYDFSKNYLKCVGPIKASSESLSHASIYSSDKSINAVIHIHNLDLWKYTIDLIPTTSHTVAYGTPEMASEISRLFSDTDVLSGKILVMGGHKEGLISFGKDLDEAGKIMLDWYKKV